MNMLSIFKRKSEAEIDSSPRELSLVLQRHKMTPDETYGAIRVGDQTIYTVERGWNNNVCWISCIPAGEYLVEPCLSPKFGKCFWVRYVPERTYIRIHRGNYPEEFNGCIGVGMEKYLPPRRNSDPIQVGVGNSTAAMKYLQGYIVQAFKLDIRDPS